MKLVFTGIQGCGKGTQARFLVENHGFTLVEMGGEFRKIIASGSNLGLQLKEILDSGAQVNAEMGIAVMEEAIARQTNEKIIFDAFVRNDWNKVIFDRELPEYQVIFFNLSEEKAKQRLLGRMFNSTTGETFPYGTKIDPKTGEKLIHRSDDNEESILKRIEEYTTKTLPILELQKKEGRVLEINADQSVEEVAKEIEEKLGL
ncbi:nucleoside monophosphate kinase [Candidatus Gracilibacteria bacterium 28_42_T64]|nr:nucleoside monophosphate kinase [Candidatus Gracilibacteria bacterium 28_42_T64]